MPENFTLRYYIEHIKSGKRSPGHEDGTPKNVRMEIGNNLSELSMPLQMMPDELEGSAAEVQELRAAIETKIGTNELPEDWEEVFRQLHERFRE